MLKILLFYFTLRMVDNKIVLYLTKFLFEIAYDNEKRGSDAVSKLEDTNSLKISPTLCHKNALGYNGAKIFLKVRCNK